MGPFLSRTQQARFKSRSDIVRIREALADRLLELIEDDVGRRNVGALMRARITNLFSIEQIAATYEKAYELIHAGLRQEIGQLNPALFS